VLAAAEAFDGRLPELFCGFDRDDLPMPVPFPTSCSPQAWASAAPIQLLRTLLRLDPSTPDRSMRLEPALPERFVPLVLSNLALDSARLTVEIDNGTAPQISGLPDGVTVSAGPQPAAALGGRRGG
jgi:glycogen debranching enzyme